MQTPQLNFFTTQTIKITWGLTGIKQEMIFSFPKLVNYCGEKKKGQLNQTQSYLPLAKRII